MSARTLPSTLRLLAVGAGAALAIGALPALPSTPAAASVAPGPTAGALDPGLDLGGSALRAVVVVARGGASVAAQAVTASGGRVGTSLPLVDGVAARMPADRLTDLAGHPAVVSVTADRSASFASVDYSTDGVANGFVRSTQADEAWDMGGLGQGVGVAVLDTGISQMADLRGRVVHGPDLSGEGSLVDTFGHGTVMAGAIAGSGADSSGRAGGAYAGVAPKATLVSVKVAGRNGAVDVSTVLQGLHWVSAYRQQLNIRVLNLSWGVPSTQDPALDPLNYAVERLWRQGVVVVVSAGNAGPGPGTVQKPADDPLVITAGAYDDSGTGALGDDAVPAWSSRGPTARGAAKPDLVAPGRSLVLARSFGSTVEGANPTALISPSYVRGSGTSQAAAVTSGLAALLIADRPELTPDQVKDLLVRTASPIPGVARSTQGAGRVRVAAAMAATPGPAVSQVAAASGLGSLEAARGGLHVDTTCPGSATATVIIGEVDVRCERWDPLAWTGSSWNGDSWTGSSWNGSSWNGSSWNGSSWNGGTWTGSSWQGSSWNGSSWNGSSWNGSSWNGSSWNGSSWNGSSWNGSSWNGSSWNGSSWGGAEDDPEDGTAPQVGTWGTAWWGDRPPFWRTVAGETSRPAPGLLGDHSCVLVLGTDC